MGTITIECEVGKVSDGYHTFDELYEHRYLLFVALMLQNPGLSWKADQHEDGTVFPGWFIAGMNLPTGTITYHLPIRMWGLLEAENIHIMTLFKAPQWDGHTSKDVINRLVAWIINKNEPESLHDGKENL